MYATHSPAWDAKNRHGLPDVMPFEYSQIAHVIPDDVLPTAAADELAEASTEDYAPEVVKAAKEQTGEVVAKEDLKAEPKPKAEPKAEPKPAEDDTPLVETAIPKALKDLMAKDGVTLDQVQSVVVARGKYPQGTPFENYDPAFVTGWIIPMWDKIVEFINK